MNVTANTPDLLILEHAALPNLLVPSAVLVLCMTLGFREGVAVGVYARGVGALGGGLAARGLGQVRVVFDKTAEHVDLRRRARLRDTHEARFELDEIARIEVEETRARGTMPTRIPPHNLILEFPKGANAGRHPLTLAGIRDLRLPGLAENITLWLRINR